MPAYNFQERFVPFVKDGTKDQTIRARRKYPARPGDPLYLFFGLRTKHTLRLRTEVCYDTRTIMVTQEGNVIIFEQRLEIIPKQLKKLLENPHRLLTAEECHKLAWKDGFRPDGSTLQQPAACFDLMLRWWKHTHTLPFIGDIIYWKPSKPAK